MLTLEFRFQSFRVSRGIESRSTSGGTNREVDSVPQKTLADDSLNSYRIRHSNKTFDN